ncbi:hypothetical protein ID866_2861 [Astraeus odoratus]|nr:hypothetical protein ID866_2861 [Astraeus odoratus]
MTDTFVQSFTHLKDMPKAERALPMLQRVASLVKPIMRKRGWVLPVLSEFFPESPNLVGKGYSELTHNVHGPHDEHFYKFLAALEDEYDTLQRSGYAGEGFFSPGHRLGASVSHNLPVRLARAKAADAAERRRKIEAVTKGGGRLGGRVGALNNLSPRELAARAAERRRRDELACGSGSVALREAAKAAKVSVSSEVIDLTSNDNGSDSKLRATNLTGVPESQTSTRRSSPLSGQLHPHAPNSHVPLEQQWTCTACTLINDGIVLQCAACLSQRPEDVSSGWTCLTCGESGIPHQSWSCHFCGTIKTQSTLG